MVSSARSAAGPEMSGRSAAVRSLARVAMFSAVAVACGYLLTAVPNVELITLVVALAGLQMGSVAGAAVGLFSITIYSGLNAWGLPFPPVWAAQMTSLALTGALFGRIRGLLRPVRFRAVLVSLSAGVIVTLFFDLLTNIAFPLSTGIPPGRGWIPFLVAAIPFAAVHLFSNAVFFALFLPVLNDRLSRILHSG